MEQHGGADSDGDAVDGGDDRLRVVGERIKEFGGVGGARGVGIGGAVLEKVFKIVPWGKYAGTAGDDHAANVRIVLSGVDRLAHGAIHLLGDRVFLFGAAQSDDACLIFIGDDQ